jgi:hypothetical protein
MAIGNLNVGIPKVVSATGNVKATQGAILGIWVSAASATPTITVYNSATTTTTDPIVTVFTPVAGTWYPIPVTFADGLYIVIGGTVSATVSYV